MIAALVAVVLLAGGGAYGARQAWLQKHRQEYAEQGLACLESQNYAQAVTAFDDAIALTHGRIGTFEIQMMLYRAEAQYRSGATGDAATTLNKLISARTDGAKDASNYNGGGDLWEMIKLQYRIEMWGEGREFYNNKRWNIPINRNKDYHPNATTLTFPVSGMVCKIPENEINYNPLVVQNP